MAYCVMMERLINDSMYPHRAVVWCLSSIGLFFQAKSEFSAFCNAYINGNA